MDPNSPRARGKDQRRSRLIRAARDLITEREDGNFSMQELATRAGLSLATPYNLLGSKASILQEVYRAETEGFRRANKAVESKPPAERIMATADHAVDVFSRSPKFYRNLSRSLSTLGSDELRQLINPLTDVMLQPLVEELTAEGAIEIAISPAVITSQLQHIFESIYARWAALDWSEAHFRKQLRTGFALIFLGLFKGKNRDALIAELIALEMQL